MKTDGQWKQIGFSIGSTQNLQDKTYVATVEFKVEGHEFNLLVKGDFKTSDEAEDVALRMLDDENSEVSKMISAVVGDILGGRITARKEGPTFTVHEGGKR